MAFIIQLAVLISRIINNMDQHTWGTHRYRRWIVVTWPLSVDKHVADSTDNRWVLTVYHQPWSRLLWVCRQSHLSGKLRGCMLSLVSAMPAMWPSFKNMATIAVSAGRVFFADWICFKHRDFYRLETKITSCVSNLTEVERKCIMPRVVTFGTQSHVRQPQLCIVSMNIIAQLLFICHHYR